MLAWVKNINSVKIKLVYVVGLLVAMVAGGATTAAVLAAIPDSGGVIHACYKSNGALSVIDSATQTCAKNDTSINWNQTGPQGPAGSGGGAVAYAHFEMSAQSPNGRYFTNVDPNFPSSNVTVLGQVDQSSGGGTFYDCLTIGGSPKGVIVSIQNNSFSAISYGLAGDSEFSALNGNANCPTGTNFILANGAGSTPSPVFLMAY
jgi:hypothetical protein